MGIEQRGAVPLRDLRSHPIEPWAGNGAQTSVQICPRQTRPPDCEACPQIARRCPLTLRGTRLESGVECVGVRLSLRAERREP